MASDGGPESSRGIEWGPPAGCEPLVGPGSQWSSYRVAFAHNGRMGSDGPAVSPRRAAAAAWLSTLLTLAWAMFSLRRFEGWGAVLVGVLVLVAIGLPLGLQLSTRDLGLGICLGAFVGLVLAGLVALVV